MSEYVKKPKTSKAFQYDRYNPDVVDFLSETRANAWMDDDFAYIYLVDKHGYTRHLKLERGDWIVVSHKGRVKVMDESKFNEKYAKVGA